jgi:hypothetical protein
MLKTCPGATVVSFTLFAESVKQARRSYAKRSMAATALLASVARASSDGQKAITNG